MTDGTGTGEGRLVFILGGARSGKSTYAELLATRLAGTGGAVCVVATATESDQEMRTRIARHRENRPVGWQTVEEPRDLHHALELAHAANAVVTIVDCLTVWLANMLFDADGDLEVLPDEESATTAVRSTFDRMMQACRMGSGTTILISNEVGMGLVPPYPSGRLYRDVLGRLNAWVAAEADEVYLLVAGLPLRIKPPPGL